MSQSSLTFLRTFPPLFSTQNLTRRNPWKLCSIVSVAQFPRVSSALSQSRHSIHRESRHLAAPNPLTHLAHCKTFPTFPLWWFDALEFSSFSSPCNAWSELAVVEQLAGGGTYHLADNPPYHYPTPPSHVFTQFLLFLPNFSYFWPISSVFPHQLSHLL